MLATVDATFTNNKHGWNTEKINLERTPIAVWSRIPAFAESTPIPQVDKSLATAFTAARVTVEEADPKATTSCVRGKFGATLVGEATLEGGVEQLMHLSHHSNRHESIA